MPAMTIFKFRIMLLVVTHTSTVNMTASNAEAAKAMPGSADSEPVYAWFGTATSCFHPV